MSGEEGDAAMSGPEWDKIECAHMRGRVTPLAQSDWQAALKLASEIPLPWYRVQSLGTIAAYAPDAHVDAILDLACAEAEKDTDQYRCLAVLAWVISAATYRGRMDFAVRLLDHVLAQAQTITPLKSRAAALELMLQRMARMGEADARRVAIALLDVAAALRKDPVAKWRRWGASYVGRVARTLYVQQRRALADELFTEQFGAERCAALRAYADARMPPKREEPGKPA
jgi:hypothetical protein